MNQAEQADAKYLRAECWLLGLPDAHTRKIIEHLPEWGYARCLHLAKSIAASLSGQPCERERMFCQNRAARLSRRPWSRYRGGRRLRYSPP